MDAANLQDKIEETVKSGKDKMYFDLSYLARVFQKPVSHNKNLSIFI